jgi:signal peptidase I
MKRLPAIARSLQKVVTAAVCVTLIATFGFQVVRVNGWSMAPTIENHDALVVDRLAYELGKPQPGDIVLLYHPQDTSSRLIKRLIAWEGDIVQIIRGRVYVNGEPLKDDYVRPDFRGDDNWGPRQVPAGYCFVMGDHRNDSSDSRNWGMVPDGYLVGKVAVRWWPFAEARLF